ncbi:MAG: hypothetical protein GXY44_14655 [Phycisphaerales bacterium]|nr:hypothetical protein [Phycisphaerales bacterium]
MKNLYLSMVTWILFGTTIVDAVETKWVRHDQPRTFTAGKLDNVVVTSRGEIELARAITLIDAVKDPTDVVNTLAMAGDGLVYAATGPRGIILRIDGEKVTEFATLPEGGTIFSLLFTREGHLLAGTGGGHKAQIFHVDGTGKVSVFYEPPDARYIWAMGRGEQGEIYAATGIKGQLHVIEPDGKSGKVLATLKPRNLLCLAIGADGMLYTGTDEDGLICRINPKNGQMFYLYDAKEPEISALVLDTEGNLYAATADAENARPGRQIADKPSGRPETTPSQPAADQPPATQPEADSSKQQAEDDKENDKSAALAPLRRTNSIGRPVIPQQLSKEGNAIYRIDQDGFVTEVFREPVMILAMTEYQGTIYAATGNEGRVYAIEPATEKQVVINKLESAQATCLLRLADGTLMVGAANAGALACLSPAYAEKGTLHSEALDAEQIVRWGQIQWDASIPEGTKLTIATRSSNVQDIESPAWEPWSQELDATAARQIPSISARFLQYRLTFETTLPKATPVLRKVEYAYIEENQAPRITMLQVLSVQEAAQKPEIPPKVKALAASGRGSDESEPIPEHQWVATWRAEDPNNDQLTFEVFSRQLGNNKWIRLAKDIEEPFVSWDTRTMQDGRFEIRVVASDRKSNAIGNELTDARISDPFIVDNTLPEVQIASMDPVGKNHVRIHARLEDTASRIKSVSYKVDNQADWMPLAADDGIFDSRSETVTFTVEDLEPGPHLISLRVSDEQGNTRYVSREVMVGN